MRFVHVIRKPVGGSIPANLIAHGCGALDIEASRIATEDNLDGGRYSPGIGRDKHIYNKGLNLRRPGEYRQPVGRWPSNLILDRCVSGDLDLQSGVTVSTDRPRHNTAEAHNRTHSMGKSVGDWVSGGHRDSGGASRFFKQV